MNPRCNKKWASLYLSHIPDAAHTIAAQKHSLFILFALKLRRALFAVILSITTAFIVPSHFARQPTQRWIFWPYDLRWLHGASASIQQWQAKIRSQSATAGVDCVSLPRGGHFKFKSRAAAALDA
jgi:hypothetical protein